MPELPEVETVVRGLNQTILSRQINSVQVFRNDLIAPLSPEEFADRLTGHTIQAVTRRAKYILFHLSPSLWLLAHLRMTGKFIITSPLPKPDKHHRIWFHLDNNSLMIFNDLRCFGTLELVESLENCKKLNHLGIEPLSPDLTVSFLKKTFKSSSSPIKNLLLNQNKIVGIGNIYASEILFEAQISPLRKGTRLSQKDLKNLIHATKKILKIAIEKNGTSISDFRRVDEQTGEFQNFLKVYGKTEKPCVRCSVPIQKIVQQQRSSFYCPACQK